MSDRGLRVLLVGNYRPDNQRSMLGFAAVLERELQHRGVEVTAVAPTPVVGPSESSKRGRDKWLGYTDKLALFPITLRQTVRALRSNGATVVHVCDHSNAIYTRCLQDVPHLVTCNDLLAIRSALGEIPGQATRWSGRLLQRRILAGLRRAQRIACISKATQTDVLRLCRVGEEVAPLVYMGLHYPYAPLLAEEGRRRVRRVMASREGGRFRAYADEPYLLHVGGNQWYKNRAGLVRLYGELVRLAPRAPLLVMVGDPLEKALADEIARRGLDARIVVLNGLDNDDLAAFYSQAEMLLFPSLYEGFGWPVLEAMACGCRVVTSARPPLTEVGGSAATYIEPDKPVEGASAVYHVLHEPLTRRRACVEEGRRRAAEFSTARMVEAYVAQYRSLAAGGPASPRARRVPVTAA